MKRILWVAKGLGRGGAEQLLLGATRHIDRERFDVEVAYLLPWKDALVPEFEAQGIVVHCLENRSPLDPRWAVGLRRLVRSGEFDLVHTHMPYVGAGARVAAPRSTVLVHTEHNLWDRYRLPTRWANLATYSRNAAVIAVSRAVADTIRVPSWIPGRRSPVEVVYHGADLDRICNGPGARSAARRKLGLAADALVVGSVGNFTAKKHHRVLLDAIATFASRQRVVHLVLVGLGPLEAELRAQVRDLSLEEHVLFTGMRDDVYELLPGFDVFALSSRYEGLPIALLEAMATGVPCVATRVGGIPEVITDGREGILVDPGDAAGLATALEKVLTDDTLRRALGKEAKQRAEDFDLRRAVRRTEATYDRCLVGR